MTHEAPAKDTDRYFEEIEVGETYSIEDARTITGADIANFAGVTGDFHPIHMSDKWTRENTEFDGRIAYGNMTAAITEAIILEENERTFSYGHDNMRFIEPVFVGDTISARREVVDKEDHDQDYGKVTYRYETTNQHGDLVHVNDHIMVVEKRD